MNRFYLILGVLCAFVVQGAGRPPVVSPSKPNIIFFLVDDYDKPETSPYGGKVLTPNLERLATEGMLFNNAYVTSTVCTPSRYTMLTGRYAGSSTSKQFLTLFPKGRQSMPGFNVSLEHDNMNVGNVLARNGYATGFVGKYHVGPEHDEDFFKEAGLFDIPKNAEYTDQLNRHKHRNEKIHRRLIQERGFTWRRTSTGGTSRNPLRNTTRSGPPPPRSSSSKGTRISPSTCMSAPPCCMARTVSGTDPSWTMNSSPAKGS